MAARLPVRLPTRPLLLAGREELLGTLHELLTKADTPRTVVLCGLGGVGKTSLAAEYAFRHLGQVAVAWQVSAEDQTVAAQGMGELAAQLGAQGVADVRDPVASAHAVLAVFPAEWLLVFDNALDADAVHRFLPPAGRGRVLVTSQSRHWPGLPVLNVPVLGNDAAARFLVSRSGDPDDASARALADELGGLPLALEQAGAYISAAGSTLAGYLGLHRDRRADLLARGGAAGHRASVSATLGLATTRLQSATPRAASLLRLLACFAPEPVPLHLLLSAVSKTSGLDPEVTADLGPLADELAAGDAITALGGYSLATPAGGEMVLVHRLVQEVTLAQMPTHRADNWRCAAAALIMAATPGRPDLPETWPACAALLPHAYALLAADSASMRQIASYLGASGQFTAARDLWRKIADTLNRTNGMADANTLAARHEYARWVGRAGEPTSARDLYQELKDACEHALGAEHPDTLRASHQLAFWTGRAGDPGQALALYAELLPVRERILGEEEPDTLTTRANLARFTGETGDAARAQALYAELLPVRERILGPEHQDTLKTRNDLAYWTGRAGDPARARDMCAELLPVRERVSGTMHPRTLATRANLARFTGEAGDAALARGQYAELLPLHERVLGPDHPDTALIRERLVFWTRKAGR